MKKSITPSECKHMFDDKFDVLSMKEIGIELKHFSIGTAPESPSFLVNQGELKRALIDKFSTFFDTNRSQGLEVIFLRSNYGNGKSHFIKTIYSFLNNYENVYAKRVSLKQETTDLKKKVLEGIGHKTLLAAATYFVTCAEEKLQDNLRDAIILSMCEILSIDPNLANLLYQAARSKDISIQSKAIAILKSTYLPDYLKTFQLKASTLNNQFYMDVIRLVCNYLSQINSYMVIVFDEYEHIYSWKDASARRSFFSDIKLFLDDIEIYKNLFFVFAESESMQSSMEASDDPAYLSRKKAQTYQIGDISSESEVSKLYEMIKVRYEKYYNISLDQYDENILKEIMTDEQVKSNNNYRNYTQAIMRILNAYRTNPKIKKTYPVKSSEKVAAKTQSESIPMEKKWFSATSISKKTYLCDALEHILTRSDEKIDMKTKSRRQGFYQTQREDTICNYHIIYTDNPGLNDFLKRYKEAVKKQAESGAAKMIMLYPAHQSLCDLAYDNVIFYDVNKAPRIIAQVKIDISHIDNVLSYLDVFK